MSWRPICGWTDGMEGAMADADERAALTSVCVELPELLAERARLAADRRVLVDRIREEAAARRPIVALLAELVGTSRTEAVRSLGAGLPGVGPGRPVEERFVCPDGACDLVVVPEPGAEAPRCNVTNRSMTPS